MESRVETLLAKQEIAELMTTYCRGVDRLDFELVRSVYHPDAHDHHAGYDGDVDGFIDWLSVALATLQGTTHLLGPSHIEIDGDHAVSETYGTCMHWAAPGDDERRNFATGVRYVDRLARRGGRWAILERWAVRDWVRSEVARELLPSGTGPVGSRDRQDPIYLAQRFLSRGTDSDE